MLSLHEKKSHIKTSEPWHELGPEGVAASTDGRGSIVIRLGLDGIRTVEIIANQSDEDAQLREWLTAARPVLELLQAVSMAER